jgi:hypothetical protein
MTLFQPGAFYASPPTTLAVIADIRTTGRPPRILLEHGASADTGFYADEHEPDPAFETVLYGAAGVANDAGLTRLLLDHGADPNDGETPYHVPERYDNSALVGARGERESQSRWDHARGETPLAYAVRAQVQSEWIRTRSAATVATLLGAGASVAGVKLVPSGFDEVDALIRKNPR